MNKKRLYFFVMYNLSGIQKGIQAGHAAEQYGRKFRDDPNYIDYVDNHKTWIILDGGGSIDMVQREKELEAFGIEFVSFQEPDLNNSVSAIAFLVDESIYNFDESIYNFVGMTPDMLNWTFEKNQAELSETYKKAYPKYLIYKYLKSFKLAAN